MFYGLKKKTYKSQTVCRFSNVSVWNNQCFCIMKYGYCTILWLMCVNNVVCQQLWLTSLWTITKHIYIFSLCQTVLAALLPCVSCHPCLGLCLSPGAFTLILTAGSHSQSDEGRDHPEAAGTQLWANWEHQQLPQPLRAAAHQCQVR